MQPNVPARFERKDESGGAPNPVLDQIKTEVAGFGGDIKKLKESLQKDISEVRSLAEGSKDSPELKQQIEALSASVGEKHGALEKLFNEQKERADALETAMNRPGSSTESKEETDRVADAMKFFDTKSAASGSLNWRSRPTQESIDLEGYKAWEQTFGSYLRVDDRDRSMDSKALSVGSNPNGGYLVPTARSNRIVQRIYETSPLRQLATVETIGTEALEIPVDQGEAGYGWVGEEEERPETSTPQVGVQRIPVHEMYAKPKVTQQFLEDAAINVEEWLANKIGDKFARVEASAFITGNGIKKPRGILTYAAGNAGVRGTIARHPSGHATQITADALVTMPFLIKGPYLSNASWLLKRSSVASIIILKDPQGQYVWRPSFVAGQPSTLVGYPLQMADDMPAVQAGALPIAFGDFRRGYTVVDRLGITTLRDPYSSKPFVEFYTRKRVGGDVVDFEAFALMVVSET